MLVGIHTYYPQALEVYRLLPLPNVLVAKTHSLLLFKLGRYARLHGRPWVQFARAALSLKGEVNDVHDHYEEGTADHDAGQVDGELIHALNSSRCVASSLAAGC